MQNFLQLFTAIQHVTLCNSLITCEFVLLELSCAEFKFPTYAWGFHSERCSRQFTATVPILVPASLYTVHPPAAGSQLYYIAAYVNPSSPTAAALHYKNWSNRSHGFICRTGAWSNVLVAERLVLTVTVHQWVKPTRLWISFKYDSELFD